MAGDRHIMLKELIQGCVKQRDEFLSNYSGTLRRKIDDATESDLLALLRKDHQSDMLHGADSVAIALDEAYPPSVQPANSLPPITISKLRTHTQHLGRSLTVTRFGPATTCMSAATYGVKDGTGAISLVLDFLIYPSDDVIPENARLVIKEPFCKVDISGRICVSVSHPSDIIIMESDNYGSAAEYKVAGNAAVKACKWRKAFDLYSKGLADASKEKDDSLKADLYRNRALAAHKLERFEDAQKDALAAIATDLHAPDLSMAKAHLRAAKAAYELGHFADCADSASRLLQYQPGDHDGLELLTRAKQRLKEERSGDYDFEAIFSKLSVDNPRVDAASFIEKTTVRPSLYGNGLFATDNFSPGDMILAEKALFAVFDSDAEGFPAVKASIVSSSDKLVAPVKQAAGHKPFVRRLFNNPKLATLAFHLHAGSYDSTYQPWRVVDGMQVVDLFHAHEVLSLNSFCIPTPPSPDDQVQPYASARGDNESGRFGLGLWHHTSHSNHSCLPNAQVALIGDLLIMRAVREIAKGEEIFLSYGSERDYYARQATFYGAWNFYCECPLCAADEQVPDDTLDKRYDLARVINSSATSMTDSDLDTELQLVRDVASTFDGKLYRDLPRQEVADAWVRRCTLHANQGESMLVEVALLSFLRELQIDFHRVNGRLTLKPGCRKKWVVTRQAVELLRAVSLFKQGQGLEEDAEMAAKLAICFYTILNRTSHGYESLL